MRKILALVVVLGLDVDPTMAAAIFDKRAPDVSQRRCGLFGRNGEYRHPLALLEMEQAYTVVLDLAGAALLLKYTRRQSQSQADNCLRSRTALGVDVCPILHRAVCSF